jgi:hypothetical protein
MLSTCAPRQGCVHVASKATAAVSASRRDQHRRSIGTPIGRRPAKAEAYLTQWLIGPDSLEAGNPCMPWPTMMPINATCSLSR